MPSFLAFVGGEKDDFPHHAALCYTARSHSMSMRKSAALSHQEDRDGGGLPVLFAAAWAQVLRLLVREVSGGVCSPYLCGRRPGDVVECLAPRRSPLRAAWEAPREASRLLLVANGAGLAPFLALLEQLSVSDSRPLYLWLGCRRRSGGLLYEERLEALEAQGALQRLSVAESRPLAAGEAQKPWVQDVLKAESEEVGQLLQLALKIEDATINTLETHVPAKQVQGAHSIKVGEGTVIHPACILHAKAGPIVIGRFNVLEEQVEVVNSSDQPLVIGDHNVLEVGARVLGGGGPRLGDANLLEIRATLDEGCSVGSGCTLGACTSLKEGEALGDEMVVIGPGVRHGEPGAKDAHVQAVLKYIEVLKET
ncbi:Dctn6, partial [Symbiodinium microadriaticum]